MARPRKPKKGDKVLVRWADITADPLMDPSELFPMVFTTIAYFVEYKTGPNGPYLLTTDTLDEKGGPYGSTAYPHGCVLDVHVL